MTITAAILCAFLLAAWSVLVHGLGLLIGYGLAGGVRSPIQALKRLVGATPAIVQPRPTAVPQDKRWHTISAMEQVAQAKAAQQKGAKA